MSFLSNKTLWYRSSLVWNLLLISVTFLLIPLFLLTFLSSCHFLFMYQLRYLSHLLRCIFYLSDDVTCSNETLSITFLLKATSAGQLCFSPEFDFHLVPTFQRFRPFKIVLWHRRPHAIIRTRNSCFWMELMNNIQLMSLRGCSWQSTDCWCRIFII